MKQHNYSNFQLVALVILRVLVGWYFLYEGLSKVFSQGWSSFGYLMDSQGIFSDMFKALAQNQVLMPVIDIVNIYGLIAIGLLLILGLFEKTAIVGAFTLLLLYYMSHPAIMDATYMLPPEGSYLWVNKNVVMMGALIVLAAFPSARRVGLARYFFKNKNLRK